MDPRRIGGIENPTTKPEVSASGRRLDLSGSFWKWLETVDINFLGFVIVAMFVATWLIALLIWRLARIEERWSAQLEDPARLE